MPSPPRHQPRMSSCTHCYCELKREVPHSAARPALCTAVIRLEGEFMHFLLIKRTMMQSLYCSFLYVSRQTPFMRIVYEWVGVANWRQLNCDVSISSTYGSRLVPFVPDVRLACRLGEWPAGTVGTRWAFWAHLVLLVPDGQTGQLVSEVFSRLVLSVPDGKEDRTYGF